MRAGPFRQQSLRKGHLSKDLSIMQGLAGGIRKGRTPGQGVGYGWEARGQQDTGTPRGQVCRVKYKQAQTRRWDHLSFDYTEAGNKKPFYLDMWVMMKRAEKRD